MVLNVSEFGTTVIVYTKNNSGKNITASGEEPRK